MEQSVWKQSKAADNETKQSRVFGSGAEQRIMKVSGADCLEAERRGLIGSKVEDNERERSRLF